MINFHIGKNSPLHDKKHHRDLDQEIEILKHYDINKTCCLDIGSNEGYFSVSMASQYEIIHAYEPILTNFQLLDKNIRPFDNIKIYNTALSDKIENFLMIKEHRNTNFNSGMCARFDTYLNVVMCNSNLPENLRVQLKTQLLENMTELVKSVTVDSLNISPSLIKIDVEGDEPKVLKGAKKTIERNRPVIYLERNFYPDSKPLDDYMMSIGYKQVPEHSWIYINNLDND